MIISVPPDTQSVSIRREGERTIIVLDQDILSELSASACPVEAAPITSARQPRRARRFRLPVLVGVCVIVIGVAAGHRLWASAKNSQAHPVAALQVPQLVGPAPATRRSIPAASQAAPVPNNAFGLE